MSVAATAQAFSSLLQCDEKELAMLGKLAATAHDRRAHDAAIKELTTYLAASVRDVPQEVNAELSKALSDRFGRIFRLESPSHVL
ncbi:MAG: hypothetical protein ABIO70_12180 [Pseudomonadota bacterium]